ncbi:hypothetical protein WA026_006379 [Henosepilachna vigintioctopunctata]|uniref:Uncharacterized protein n=1 Tax=Henosepilachna vigintioctopunctata TaxID=420089 RepID=A0AAW1TPP1_9CUCU
MTRWWWLNMCHSGHLNDSNLRSNSSSLNAHSPDYGFRSSPPGIREAANNLVSALQNTNPPPAPEPHVAKALLDWIQQFACNFHFNSRARKWSGCNDVFFMAGGFNLKSSVR